MKIPDDRTTKAISGLKMDHNFDCVQEYLRSVYFDGLVRTSKCGSEMRDYMAGYAAGIGELLDVIDAAMGRNDATQQEAMELLAKKNKAWR